MKTSFRSNDPVVICRICGVKFHRSQCRFTWDGYLACLPNNCWYPKHPCDSPLPVVIDNLLVPDASPDIPPDFITEIGRTRWSGAWFIETEELGKPFITLNNPKWGFMKNAKWGQLG